MTQLIALDLFAGHGWGVACQQLGIKEYGVELMPEAVATREANGMETIYHDVWEGLEGDIAVPDYDLLIASPPCQTFSMAGKGAGRAALDEVVGLIDSGAYRDVARLREFGERHDPRTALVLTPLTHVYRDRPRYVVMEQVPTVLPVWQRVAGEMRSWGYSVWTGVLNAEQYGVPQTRKRAILIAKRNPEIDGEASPPMPTHSRYYSHDPKRLDPGVLPWVSMAEALGWSTDEAAGFARKADDKGAATPDGYRARDLRLTTLPAQHVTEKARSWSHRRPASTIVGTRRSEGGMLVGRQLDDDSRRDSGGKPGGVGIKPGDLPGVRVTTDEAAALQSYPPAFTFSGTKTKQFLQIGNAVPPLLAKAILQSVVDK